LTLDWVLIHAGFNVKVFPLSGLSLRAMRPLKLQVTQEQVMSDHVYKLIELVGSSTTSTDEAIRSAIEKAATTIKHIGWFEVVQTRGHVVAGKVAHFQVTLKVGYRMEE